MRYVLLLLTLLTAGFSVWYYQNRISPEGKELAAQNNIGTGGRNIGKSRYPIPKEAG